MKTFTPIGRQVAMTWVNKDEMTNGGIVLPEGSMSKMIFAVTEVVAVGPECKQVKEGDRVLIDERTMLKRGYHRGVEYYVIEETLIAGVEISKEEVLKNGYGG